MQKEVHPFCKRGFTPFAKGGTPFTKGVNPYILAGLNLVKHNKLELRLDFLTKLDNLEQLKRTQHLDIYTKQKSFTNSDPVLCLGALCQEKF